MELSKWISKNDALIMLEMVNSCLFCKKEEDFRRVVERLKALLYFDNAISGLMELQRISYDNLVSTSINIGYPSAYLETYADNKYHFIDPLYKQFDKTLEVQNTDDLSHFYNDGAEKAVSGLREDFGISNIFLYGLQDPCLNCSTLLSIAGKQIENDQRTRAIIKYLMPYLSLALRNLIQLPGKENVDPLTPTELETLKWLKNGKSSWEISIIMDKSERVVNFHIGNIIRKLNANNRAHAVAIALEKNVIFM